MSIKKNAILLILLSLSLVSCNSRQSEQSEESSTDDEVLLSEEDEATICEQELLEAEEEERTDASFDDFLYTFLRSGTFRHERTANPLLLSTHGKVVEVEDGIDGVGGFSFLDGDYFTELYANVDQIDAIGEEDDTIACIERINLCDNTVRSYHFTRRQEKWALDALSDVSFSQHENCDFLTFYARFCSDSIFQQEHIANPLHISVQDDEAEDVIEGTIDPSQWTSFCSDVPTGVISNIHRGQKYSVQHMVLRKCGQANGLQELFTFSRTKDGWLLTAYEN